MKNKDIKPCFPTDARYDDTGALKALPWLIIESSATKTIYSRAIRSNQEFFFEKAVFDKIQDLYVSNVIMYIDAECRPGHLVSCVLY